MRLVSIAPCSQPVWITFPGRMGSTALKGSTAKRLDGDGMIKPQTDAAARLPARCRSAMIASLRNRVLATSATSLVRRFISLLGVSQTLVLPATSLACEA